MCPVEKNYMVYTCKKILRVDLHGSTGEKQQSCNYQGKMIIFA